MGSRKRLRAEKLKEDRKTMYAAKLNNCPTSPRKMRLLVDLIKGREVFDALNVLRFSSKEASVRLEKLLRSAIANWEAKNTGKKPEEENLIVSNGSVDSGRILKRLRPAPQGRAHRIRKRSNHVTLIIDTAN